MRKRVLRTKAWLVLVVLLIEGCSGLPVIRDTPIQQAQRRARAPLQSVTPVSVPGGTLTFYRYVRGTECGSGYVFDVNGATNQGGGMAGPCDHQQSLEVSCEAGAGGQKPFGVCHGEVNDRQIARVRVSFQGADQPVEATVINGYWYVFLPGQRIAPTITRTDGLDADGRPVVQYPIGQP